LSTRCVTEDPSILGTGGITTVPMPPEASGPVFEPYGATRLPAGLPVDGKDDQAV
jgi:hypothetical protein